MRILQIEFQLENPVQYILVVCTIHKVSIIIHLFIQMTRNVYAIGNKPKLKIQI